MTEFRIERNQSDRETDAYDCTIVDTANPFGNYATFKIDDRDGDKFGNYPRGTRIDIYIVDDVPGTLRVRSGDTRTIGNDDVVEATTAEVEGTLQVGGTEKEIALGNTYSISSGESEKHEVWQVEGTLQVEGTAEVANQGNLKVGTSDEIQRFTGYVVERRELDENGADALEVECQSFDQFLRRGQISNDQLGKTISSALEDIIKTDTPVSWDSSNVTVADDVEITQSFQGDRVENALLELRQKSANEQFGVNDSVEFFFEPREQNSAPRDIDNTQWLNYDIPEVGRETINEVTVFYNDGAESVTVDDGRDKLDLQDNLGTARPAGFSTEISRPNITELEDAKDVAESVLQGRATTLTGTVTTFGLYNASPGDVLDIEIIPRGIDDNFQIAELSYRWGTDTTTLTIVEKRGNQDDLLVRLSDTVKRVELKDTDRSGISNRVVDPAVGCLVDPSGDVDGTPFDRARITNELRNQIRDGWGGDGTVDVETIKVGDDASRPKRSQTRLSGSVLDSASVSQNLPDSSTARYTASLSASGVREVGLFNGSDNLLARATLSSTGLSGATITFDLTAKNDSDASRAAITDTGQTTVRDIIADNSPSTVQKVAYGSDGTDPTESDTSLGTQEKVINLNELLIQTASDQSSWDRTVNVSDENAVTIENSTLKLLQSCYLIEAEDGDIQSATALAPGSSYSDSALNPDGAFSYGDTSDWTTWTFETERAISSDNLAVAVRYETVGSDPVEAVWKLDSSQIASSPTGDDGLQWDQNIIGTSNVGDLDAGTHSIELKVVGSGADNYIVDLIAVYDDRFSYTFDNVVNADNALAGPELFPDAKQVLFNEAKTGRTVESASVTQSWNDTSNSQAIELSNDGGSTWNTINNSQTASANFSSPETGVDTRVTMSQFGSQSVTPTSGINGQEISSHDLEADIDAVTASDTGVANVRSVIQPNQITGTTLKEIGQLDTNDNLLTREIFAQFTVLADQRVLSSESVTFSNP